MSTFGESATRRLERAVVRFAGFGILIYCVIVTPDVIHQTFLMQWWWTPVAVLAAISSAIALLATSWISRRALRYAVIYSAAMFAVTASLWFLAWNGQHIDAKASFWLGNFAGIAAIPAPVAWRIRWVGAYLIVGSILGALINWTARDEHGHHNLILEIAWSASYTSLFVAGCWGLLRTGRLLDASADAARHQVAVQAAADARAIERRRVDGLVHDGVMATLLDAARSPSTAVLQRQARATLDQLSTLRSPARSIDPPFGEALARLRDAMVAVDDRVTLPLDQSGGAPATLPHEVVNALSGGIAEAVRNVARHAAHSRCTVAGTSTTDGIAFSISDDGPGFEPKLVSQHRLGIAMRIVGPMQAIPGAWAHVDSTVGVGTTVSLGWRSP